MRKRVAFVTIGQAPRPDILDEMLPLWGDAFEIEEHGALDGLSRDDITALGPTPGEARLVSRLRDGSEVVLRADAVHDRVERVVRRLDDGERDVLVLLCTGPFEGLESRSFLLKAQAVVDYGMQPFCEGAIRIGVLVPHAQQRETFHYAPSDGQELVVSHASPYSDDRFDEAAEELSASDVIVLHCMGYTEAQRARIAERTGRPVLLARRLVASAVAQLA